MLEHLKLLEKRYEELQSAMAQPEMARDPNSIRRHGQEQAELSLGESVVIREGGARVDLVRIPGQTFFSTLRNKLNWASRPHGET